MTSFALHTVRASGPNRRWRAGGLAVLMLLLGAGCDNSGTSVRDQAIPATLAPTLAPPPTPPESTPAALRSPTVQPTPSNLPRDVSGVNLRMSRADVAQQIGELNCHDNPEGFEVCHGSKTVSEGKYDVEVYFHRDQVLSLAYDTSAPEDAWTLLDELVRRYGTPSLSGLAERDKDGRLHEIYGWKDEATLYSVRFIWKEDQDTPRKLVGTNYTLWDRKSYDAWEQERAKRPPTPAAPVPDPLGLPTPELT